MITIESSNGDGYVNLTGDVGRLEIHDRLMVIGDRGTILRIVALGALCQAKVARYTSSTAPLVGRRVELVEE